MLEILLMGICLVLVCDSCVKGRKLKWYEMILFVLTVLIFVSMVDNYYI